MIGVPTRGSRWRTSRAAWIAGACLFLATACERVDIRPDVEATLSAEIPTVATVSWDLVNPGASGAFVEFGRDRDHDRRARAEVGQDGHAVAHLVGMKPDLDHQFRVVEVVDERPLVSRRWDIHTGELPLAVPAFSIEIHDPDRASDGYLVTSVFAQPSAALILDMDGDVVWAHQPDLDWEQLQITRALRSWVGEHVVYQAGVGYDTSVEYPELERKAVRVSLDGTRQDILPTPDAHHDLFERGDGGYTTLTLDIRTVEGQEIAGDRLVEFDLDGTQRQVWTVWDHFEFNPDLGYSPDLGWSHANAVDYVKGEGAYYVSLHNLDCIVKIDRTTGEQLWVLGGRESDFTLADGSTTLFQRQHQFVRLDDGILVFDNGTAENNDSRVVEYALDEATGAAELRWEFHLDPPRFNVAMGDVYRLPNGNTLITWSSLGQIDEVTPEGEVVWRLRSEIGKGFGFTMWRENLSNVVVYPGLETKEIDPANP